MNPKVAASRTRPLHFRRHGVIFAKSRELQIATLSLLLLFLIAPALQAQTPQPQPPAVRETARPGIAQGFLGWFRQRRQSRAASPPPLPRPRPAELTPTPAEPSPASAERPPASGEPDQTSVEVAPAPTSQTGRQRPFRSTNDRPRTRSGHRVRPPIIVIALLEQISREMETHSALDKPRRRRF
jgi:hypothetical protein